MRFVIGRIALALAPCALALAAVLAFAVAAKAEGGPRKGKIAAPKQAEVYTPLPDPLPETLGWKAHNFYAGVMGSYAWRPDPDKEEQAGPLADEWQLGILAGYLYRSGATGWAGGVEVDWTPHAWDRLSIDDGTFTVRGRAGAFVTSKTFIYGTAGFMLDQDALTGLTMQGPVVGGGVEVDITTTLAIRAEVLHYRYGADYLDWGEDGATQMRLGAAVKF